LHRGPPLARGAGLPPFWPNTRSRIPSTSFSLSGRVAGGKSQARLASRRTRACSRRWPRRPSSAARSSISARYIAARPAASRGGRFGFRRGSIQSNGCAVGFGIAGTLSLSIRYGNFRALGRLPEPVLLVGRGVGHGASLPGQRPFEVAEPAGEAIGRLAQRLLGVEPQLARQVHGGEQQVAELPLHLAAVAGAAGLVELAQLLVDLGARPVGVGPVEPHRAGLLARAGGAQEGGGALRDAVERPVFALLRLLLGLQ